MSEAGRAAFGEWSPWTQSLPVLWRELALPDPDHALPEPVWNAAPGQHPEDIYGHGLDQRIRFWTPLLHLAMGRLGWVDPGVGAASWVQAGMPTDDPALELMARWWGDSVLGLCLWDRESPMLGQITAEVATATGTTVPGRPDPVDAPGAPDDRTHRRWADLFAGGGDGLHLSVHVPLALIGSSELGQAATSLMLDHATGDAVLVLDRYVGWYRVLAEEGARLPARPGGRSWRVHVVVQQIGWMGQFRRSRLTGRWFAGRHRWHQLGWPEAGRRDTQPPATPGTSGQPASTLTGAGQPVFVGIDLAWSDQARTGLAVVDQSGALLDSTSQRSDEDIDQWLDRSDWAPVVAAIDAPLVVANMSGMRPCERMVSRQFGAFGASCHTSNLSRSWFDPPRGATLAQRHGWDLDPERAGDVDHPVCIEVYPHPAMVTLFGLDRVIPYKGKSGRSVEFRQAAFRELINHMNGLDALHLELSPRWAALCAAVDRATRQVDLDRIEDEIDAIFCAHLAWLWHHHRDALHVYGDLDNGYIITPPPAQQ